MTSNPPIFRRLLGRMVSITSSSRTWCDVEGSEHEAVADERLDLGFPTADLAPREEGPPDDLFAEFARREMKDGRADDALDHVWNADGTQLAALDHFS